ncbi:MAG: glycosyltransferase family 1 protein [Planctomycetota bacterium]|nr:MAG: glycosyltransferase family 1 protein [Planctomycetota bacterium]
MKILEVNTEKTWRGGERQTLYNILGFLKKGHQVHLLARRGGPLAMKSRKETGIPVFEVSSLLGAWWFLVRHGSKYDIVHVQTARTQSVAILAKSFYQRPVVYTRRSNFFPKTGLFSKWKYEKTDCLSANSYHIGEVLHSFGIQKEVIVLREVVEEEELDRERAENLKKKLGIENKKILATAGALVPHKDPFNMIHAISELYQKRQDFVFLHFGDGEMRDAVEKEIQRCGLEKVFLLMGFHEKVQDFYSIFDVFVMSSDGEGTPNTVLDAFLYKVPVVATRAGGTPEILEGRGILCPIKDPKALALGIEQILDSPELSQEYVEKAYAYVKEHHSLEKVTQDYLDTFQKVLSKE